MDHDNGGWKMWILMMLCCAAMLAVFFFGVGTLSLW